MAEIKLLTLTTGPIIIAKVEIDPKTRLHNLEDPLHIVYFWPKPDGHQEHDDFDPHGASTDSRFDRNNPIPKTDNHPWHGSGVAQNQLKDDDYGTPRYKVYRMLLLSADTSINVAENNILYMSNPLPEIIDQYNNMLLTTFVPVDE